MTHPEPSQHLAIKSVMTPAQAAAVRALCEVTRGLEFSTRHSGAIVYATAGHHRFTILATGRILAGEVNPDTLNLRVPPATPSVPRDPLPTLPRRSVHGAP